MANNWGDGYGYGQQPDSQQSIQYNSQYGPPYSPVPPAGLMPTPDKSRAWKIASASLATFLTILFVFTVVICARFSDCKAEKERINNKLISVQDDAAKQKKDLQAAFDAAKLPDLYKTVTDADADSQDAWNQYNELIYDSSATDTQQNSALNTYVSSWGICITAIRNYDAAASANEYTAEMFQAVSLPEFIDMTNTTTDCSLQDFIDVITG